jgi:hypothetical protein
MTDTPDTPDIDRRLRSALHTEVDGLRPERGSLDVIRRRGRAARRRRAGVLAGVGLLAVVVAGVVVVPRDDRSGDDIATDPSPTPTTEAPGVLTDPEPAVAVDDALWPDPAGELFTDPVEAARSFVQVVIGVDEPPLSAFVEGEPGAGEVEVYRRGEDGRPLERVASTIVVRQLDGEHWFVTAAGSDDVQIELPEPLAEAESKVTVSGQGRGYEGTIVAELRSRSVDAPELVAIPTIAGAGEELAPFSVDLPFGGPVGETPDGVPAVLVVRDDPGVDQGVPSFAAQLLRLTAAAQSGEPEPPAGPSTTVPEQPAYEFTSQPLWPFRTQADADAWLAVADEGHQPWHAGAEATAQFFTMNYLGFSEIDQIVDSDVRETEAWVHVGYEAEPGVLSTAAVIHLVRFGPSPDAPWEVVGTTDDVLTLDTPRYGSDLSSSLVVGGTITGVDESIQVDVRQISSPEPLGTWCCVPIGGERAWWETPPVPIAGATDPAVTVVAWSGGHVQDVEVFAITGLRN